ncbi:MAG: hypothetical protein ACOVRN_00925 [Flavobacterium sp.]
MFVKKIYHEGKSKNPNYEFKQALVDASKRKSEMKQVAPFTQKRGRKSTKKTRGKKRTRKHRRH